MPSATGDRVCKEETLEGIGLSSGRRAVFLDRDGVINKLVRDSNGVYESPLRVEDVCLTERAVEHIDRLRGVGFLILCVTNQPAAAKAKALPADLDAIQREVLRLLESGGSRIDGTRVCLHHPAGVVPELTGRCDCRKPAPGMLRSLADEFSLDLRSSWMIGDADTDVAAGAAAGVSTVLVLNPGSVHKRVGSSLPDFVARDLGEAVSLVVSHSSAKRGGEQVTGAP